MLRSECEMSLPASAHCLAAHHLTLLCEVWLLISGVCSPRGLTEHARESVFQGGLNKKGRPELYVGSTTLWAGVLLDQVKDGKTESELSISNRLSLLPGCRCRVSCSSRFSLPCLPPVMDCIPSQTVSQRTLLLQLSSSDILIEMWKVINLWTNGPSQTLCGSYVRLSLRTTRVGFCKGSLLSCLLLARRKNRVLWAASWLCMDFHNGLYFFFPTWIVSLATKLIVTHTFNSTSY